jgi:hypothetical protein
MIYDRKVKIDKIAVISDKLIAVMNDFTIDIVDL